MRERLALTPIYKKREMHPELSKLAFNRTWRPYQQRVLDACLRHLADRKLHVVAAPGAGKTTLGLELFRRLGAPAVVLSPTRTIRDQWIERLRDFVPADSPWPPPWVSRELDTPALLTSLTYQALHTKSRSAPSDDEEELNEDPTDPKPIDGSEIEDVATALKAAGIGTIILDEAHHLRTEWWKALSRLIERIGDVYVIALTATPPYDAVRHEWSKYEELCGVIDEEISIHQVGLAVRDTLCALRLIDSPASKIAVESHSDVSISGGSFRDQQLFSDCMREILSTIENPRCLIIREGYVLGPQAQGLPRSPTGVGREKGNGRTVLTSMAASRRSC